MQESLRICSKINTENFISLCINFVGILQLFGEYQRAKNLLVKCLKKVPNPSPRRINILNYLGSILRFTGEYELSIEFLTESLKLNQTIQDFWQEAYAHNTLGMVHTLIGDVEKATEHYNSSLKLNKKNDDYNGLGFTYGAFAWLESNQGNLIQAKKYYETSISIFEKHANSTPAIILLAYAEILSRMGDKYVKEIKEICNKAQKIIWAQQKHLDYGRYYNTLGNIALNQRDFEQALREFSLALEYSDSFEVETQTLLGIIKTNLELFLDSPTDEYEYLDKVRLFLNDLKTAAESSALISGEIDLILGIIEMHSQNYQKAVDKFEAVLKHAQGHNYNLLVEKVLKQKEILQILQTHDQLQKVTSMTDHELKRTSIREAIAYLAGLTKLLNTQTKENKP
jgi:tetratricopeptide (TPR) repeat protein